jgi:hypothetical protein
MSLPMSPSAVTQVPLREKRGLPRGLSRGLARGLYEGLHRGLHKDLCRGLHEITHFRTAPITRFSAGAIEAYLREK